MQKHFTLAELRKKKKTSQRELATLLSKINKNIKFSSSSIANYELGFRTPGLTKAKIIANYFEVPVEAIIFGYKSCETKAKRVNKKAI